MEITVELKHRIDNQPMHDAQGKQRTAYHDAARRLRELGQRVTAQRVAVLTTFAAGEHLTAEEVCARLSVVSQLADRSTVYRVLEHFRDLGLLSEIDLGHGVRSFELLGPDRHHHLVCLNCKAVLAFDDDLVAQLRQAIDERHHFTTRLDHLAVFGLCAACADHQPAGSGTVAEPNDVNTPSPP